MRVRHLLLAVTAALSVGCADAPTGSPGSPVEPGPPSRIVSGVPDAGQHPYVVLLVFRDASGAGWLCTGSLLSSTVVLTAGHCTDGAVTARAYTNEVIEPPLTSFAGTPYTYEEFCVACGNGYGLPGIIQGDVGVVVLSQAVPTSVVAEYAQLPTPGQVDALAKGSAVDITGYGVSRQIRGGGPPEWDYIDGVIVRRRASAKLISGEFVHSDAFIRISGNAAQGKGATCFGDSGGPNLIGDTDTVIAVTSYGPNGTACAGVVSYSYRIDTPEVLAWINSFL